TATVEGWSWGCARVGMVTRITTLFVSQRTECFRGCHSRWGRLRSVRSFFHLILKFRRRALLLNSEYAGSGASSSCTRRGSRHRATAARGVGHGTVTAARGVGRGAVCVGG